MDFSNVTSNIIVKANYKEIEKEAPKATETLKVTETPKTPIVSSETPKSGDNNTNVIVLGLMMMASATTMLLSKFLMNKSKKH